MILGSTQNLAEYPFLDEMIKTCFEYASENDLLSYEVGTYTIDGEKLFVKIVEYETTVAEQRVWEAHKRYLDLQLLLDGKEQMDFSFMQNMEILEYIENDDLLLIDGTKSHSAVLEKGDFVICYPSDGHRGGITVGEPQHVKKAVFKVQTV